jgi:hypothetical protein
MQNIVFTGIDTNNLDSLPVVSHVIHIHFLEGLDRSIAQLFELLPELNRVLIAPMHDNRASYSVSLDHIMEFVIFSLGVKRKTHLSQTSV